MSDPRFRAWCRWFAAAVVLLTGGTTRAGLHFPKPRAQLGEVRSGAPLNYQIKFINRGPGPVTITDVQAACGCLAPRPEKRTYQPGEGGSIPVEVNTLTQPAGPQSWRVRVMYEEAGEAREASLYLLATLRREIKVEPPKLTLHTAGPIHHEITVTDLRDKSLMVTHALTSSPHFVARVTRDAEAAGSRPSYRVRLDVKESLPEGTHEEVLSIVTDDPIYRELRVPVTVVKRSRGAVRAAPRSVTLTIPRGRPAPSRIVLLSAGEEKVAVERIETDHPALTCRWAKGPGKMVTLKISADSAKVSGEVKGTVRVHVGKPAPAVVTIPVRCVVR